MGSRDEVGEESRQKGPEKSVQAFYVFKWGVQATTAGHRPENRERSRESGGRDGGGG